MLKGFSFFVFFISILGFFLSCSPQKTQWLVYYGDKITEHDLAKIDIAILEPDHISPKKFSPSQTKYIGYVSVGEAEEYRSYWFDIAGKDFILEKNPNWEKNHLIDIRSKEWQDILLNKIIPPILNKGYDGLFLDTIDTAIYLEDTQAEKFKGSKKAMVDFIKTLRKKYPQIIILPNNGLELILEFARDIDGVVVEDLYTRYDFTKKQSVKTPQKDSEYKEKILANFKNFYKKPIYNILYSEDFNSDLAKHGILESEKRDFNWYLTTVDLMQIGTLQK